MGVGAQESRRWGHGREAWIAFAVAALLGLFGASAVSMERSLGWDESMHAGLPAARMALATDAGQWGEALDVALDCQQYPPAYPLLLSVSAGAGEDAARRTGRWLWAAGLFGLFGLVRRLAAGERAERWAPWIAMGLGATSPLWLAYSGTLFLEGPFLTAATFALWAWVARGGAATERGRIARELLAGALITLAFFTKFNYGLLLGAGLGLDLACEGARALRAGEGRAYAARTAFLAAPFALAAAWWFLLPLPAGAEVAAGHRAAFASFLGGNTQLATTSYERRLWDAAAFFAPSPRALAVWLVGLALAVGTFRRPGPRAMGLVLVASFGPILAHNFHLDRFLLGGAAPLWALAGLGLARLLPARPARAAIVAAAASGLTLVAPTADARLLTRALGLRTEDNAAYVDGLQADRLSLRPGRPLPTAGLARGEYDALLDAVAAAVGPEERIGWLGITSELSPAALHLGLLERGGSSERFRRDAGRVRPDGEPAMVVTFQAADPGWTPERLRAWAAEFDVVLSTSPLDWKGRRGREFLETYRGWLFETGAWAYERLTAVEVARPVGPPTAVELFACRPNGS